MMRIGLVEEARAALPRVYKELTGEDYKYGEQPESGECEFRGDNEQYAVTPQYKRLDKELIEQLP